MACFSAPPHDRLCAPDSRFPAVQRMVPATAAPLFKTFYSRRHFHTFGAAIQYVPLGPHAGFTRVSQPAERPLLFNLVASATDPGRAALAAELRVVLRAPGAPRARLHVAGDFELLGAAHGDHLPPLEYAGVLANSSFTLCPRVRRSPSRRRFRLTAATAGERI